MPELHFKGKEFVFNHHLGVPYRPLQPDATKSVGGAALDGNLIIQGDNLHALKALMPLYAGKVDCIFIDPPYNTGNEGWSYNDNVNSPILREWLTTNPVDKEDMLRHDKWLCLMYPRIKLLHELMAEQGLFWMTLDDNECHRARMMLDEIFGEDNFIANISWIKRYTRSNNAKMFYSLKDSLIVYRKSTDVAVIKEPRSEKADAGYTNPDNDPRGPWITSSYVNPATKEKRKNLVYKIENPFSKDLVEHPTHAWKYKHEEHLRHVAENRLWWGVNGEAQFPRLKLYLDEADQMVPVDVWNYTEVGSTDDGGDTIKQIFGSAVFDTPKPVKLIEKILTLINDKDAIVLDSFAGSGTTAHSVLSLNKKDGGNRKFILVECENYADNVTAERVRRVINGYEFEGTEKEELLSTKISFTSLKKADKLLKQIQGIENLEGHRFDKITKKIENDTLTVVGEIKVTEKVDGLGGSFTYCTLGEPLDLDKLLTGEALPDYLSLGSWLFHTATMAALEPAKVNEAEWYLGESSQYHVWLVYRPELEFLKSRDAALTLNLAQKIAAVKTGKKHLVFAAAKFVPNKDLLPMGVEFSPLPFALYRVEK